MSLSTANDYESTIPIVDLINEINVLLEDYSHVHGAPKQVIDTLTDIEYLSSTVNYLEALFGDSEDKLHLPEQAAETLKDIKLPLKVDLKQLHHVLRKWPDPPTFAAMVTFGALHNSEVRSLRKKIIRHQLSFTVLLGETIILPEDEFAGYTFSLATSSQTGLEERISETNTPLPIEKSSHPPQEVEIEQEEYSTPHLVWSELVNLLLTLPPTMRLSHLVQKLEYLEKITSSSSFPDFSVFGEDIASLLGLARELDERALKENWFAEDVQRELHTTIDLSLKFLLHELTLLGTVMKKGLFHPNETSLKYDTLPIHGFLQDHCSLFMTILTLVAGSRLTSHDSRHQEGSRRDDEFEAALAAVMGAMARHSARVNGWCEERRSSPSPDRVIVGESVR